jgi:hypothetical protein
MSCGFCHVGPHPLNPPADPENPEWKNLSSVIGNQSCNGSYACENAGFSGTNSPSVIGNRSCNGAADLSDPDFPVGICDGNVGTIGNNKNNTP